MTYLAKSFDVTCSHTSSNSVTGISGSREQCEAVKWTNGETNKDIKYL